MINFPFSFKGDTSDDRYEPTSSTTRESYTFNTTTTSTTTTEMYPSISPNDHQTRWDRQNVPRVPSAPTNPPDTYPYRYLPPAIEIDPSDNQRNNQHGYQYGGGDTVPSANFPSNQQPVYTPRTDIRRNSHRQPHITITTGARQQPPGYRYDRPLVQPPRSILYPPRLTPVSSRRNVRRPSFSQFYFTKNYTEEVAHMYERNIKNAKDWLVAQRDKSYNWGRDTPRALIALSLIHNSFTSDVEDNELMRKGLQTHLGIKLLR